VLAAFYEADTCLANLRDVCDVVSVSQSQSPHSKAGAKGRRIPVAQLNLLLLPLVTYYLYFCVAFNDGALLSTAQSDWGGFLLAIVPTWEAGAVYLGWCGFQAVLQVFAPGAVVDGLPLADGSTLTYKINGLSALLITTIVLVVGVWLGWFSLSWIHDNFGALLSVIVLFCFLFSLFLYFHGKSERGQPGRITGDFFVDYFMGTSLNPRWPPVTGFDFKFFCESRPGLIGWMVIDFGLASAQYERYGFVSTSMVLVCGMQLFYIVHYFWAERFILSTIDVRTERFGWMLVYGDLAWVPMTYCIQAFYLIDHVHSLPLWAAALILALNFAGFYVFRETNMQKDRFRRDPEHTAIWGKKAEYLDTARGSKLLVSGFWGWARHINYLGDEMMALAWSLPCLFGSIVPYFYPIWFWLLLVMRERRDDRWCAKKYGADWDRYRERVPWRIIPGVY
jgi:protein-S-isoprenylcysteine O-methyltransferase Ste14